jgi:hypothetical protein
LTRSGGRHSSQELLDEAAELDEADDEPDEALDDAPPEPEELDELELPESLDVDVVLVAGSLPFAPSDPLAPFVPFFAPDSAFTVDSTLPARESLR